MNPLDYRSPPDKRPSPSKLCPYALLSLLGALVLIPASFIGLSLQVIGHFGGHVPPIRAEIVDHLLIFGPAAVALVGGILALRAIKAADGDLHGTALAWISLSVSVPYLAFLLFNFLLFYLR